jgi:hypothetical protein
MDLLMKSLLSENIVFSTDWIVCLKAVGRLNKKQAGIPTDVMKCPYLQISYTFINLFLKFFLQGTHAFKLHVQEEKWYIITTRTQLYLCINQLHISAIYSRNQAEHRTTKKTYSTIQKKLYYIFNGIVLYCIFIVFNYFYHIVC